MFQPRGFHRYVWFDLGDALQTIDMKDKIQLASVSGTVASERNRSRGTRVATVNVEWFFSMVISSDLRSDRSDCRMMVFHESNA